MITFNAVAFSGELNLKELAILGSKYGEGEISIKQGEAITWSRPKQDVKNILQQLWIETLNWDIASKQELSRAIRPGINQKRDDIPVMLFTLSIFTFVLWKEQLTSFDILFRKYPVY